MTARALIAAIAGSAAFVTVATAANAGALTLARLALLGAALAAAAVYDLAERRIPNRIVLPATVVCAALAIAHGAGVAVVVVVVLMLVAALFGVSLVRPAAFGMGDAKLALLIAVGADGSAVPALAIGLALAALAGIALVLRDGRTAWRATLSLAPFLAMGALAAVVLS